MVGVDSDVAKAELYLLRLDSGKGRVKVKKPKKRPPAKLSTIPN